MLEPTVNLIESKGIVEGRDYEFKQQVDFTDARQKSNIVDDVTAFLNAERPGHILIGVKEKAGGFAGFSPILEDPDQLVRRVISLLQDNIEPRPLQLDVRALAVDGGTLLHIAIGEHRMGPYQNRLNGAFYVRTGAKNTPLRRDELAAYFVDRDRYDDTLRSRLGLEDGGLNQRAVMSTKGAVLDIGILPREHFDRSRAPFEQTGHVLKAAPGYHFGGRQPFRGTDSGHEAIERDLYDEGICRVLVAEDWFIHAQVVHPIDHDSSGRVKIHEFKDELTAFLEDLDRLVSDEGLKGPFGVSLMLRRLQSAEKIAWVFQRADGIALPRPAWTERIADPKTIELFHRRLVSVSAYG
ncbi:helix-turn-helix domain-containing protein [Caulobacter sp. UC70_42]|uniref:AlbA family DNA-binding domain-containing protein n=1 Tax=Caulobacter sp. UC70_42 TaxID=3374551 RepID=UPI003756FA4D